MFWKPEWKSCLQPSFRGHWVASWPLPLHPFLLPTGWMWMWWWDLQQPFWLWGDFENAGPIMEQQHGRSLLPSDSMEHSLCTSPLLGKRSKYVIDTLFLQGAFLELADLVRNSESHSHSSLLICILIKSAFSTILGWFLHTLKVRGTGISHCYFGCSYS